LPAGTLVSVFPVTESAGLALALPKAEHFVVAFAVNWETPSGKEPTALKPVALLIKYKAIRAKDVLAQVTSSGLVAAGTVKANATATVNFRSGRTFLVATAPSQGKVAPAPHKSSGKPAHATTAKKAAHPAKKAAHPAAGH
jgi:hypothetical protein